MNSCRQWMFLELILLLQLTYWMLFRYFFNHQPWKQFLFLTKMILQKHCDLKADISSLSNICLILLCCILSKLLISWKLLCFILNITWFRFLWLYWHIAWSLTIVSFYRHPWQVPNTRYLFRTWLLAVMKPQWQNLSFQLYRRSWDRTWRWEMQLLQAPALFKSMVLRTLLVYVTLR